MHGNFNSRRGVRYFVAAILLVVLLAGVLPGLGASQATLSQNDALSATADILKTVSRLRNLSIIEPVKSGFKTHDEIEASVIKDMDEDTTLEEFEGSRKTLVKMGLLPEAFPLRDYTVKLLKEQIAGYYEPKTKIFYLAAWLPISEQKTVMAHELTHALQDQHFNLRRFEKWPKGDSDAELAIHSLVEGEATVIMIEYSLEAGGSNTDITRLPSLTERMLQEQEHSAAEEYPVLAAAPAVLREELGFPYVYGAGFVQEVLRNKSWQALDSCYQHLPASSAQIMHPEKFLAGEKPIKITLQSLEPVLGPDWKQIDQDVNGEFGYMLAMNQFIDKRRSGQAASGWAGDHYAMYENKRNGNSILAQYTTWESPAAANDFMNAYSDRTGVRYHTRHASNPDPNTDVYNTEEGLAYLSLNGNDVLIVEGASNTTQLKAITDVLWKSKKEVRN